MCQCRHVLRYSRQEIWNIEGMQQNWYPGDWVFNKDYPTSQPQQESSILCQNSEAVSSTPPFCGDTPYKRDPGLKVGNKLSIFLMQYSSKTKSPQTTCITFLTMKKISWIYWSAALLFGHSIVQNECYLRNFQLDSYQAKCGELHAWITASLHLI